ncbi:MAG: AAA family ATPase [Candidatus Accumulibacter sp.]|jgi:type II secretory pathway predicted ATPase ExeA|nr:AAA family ATPase [Accumulibacter sp.]
MMYLEHFGLSEAPFSITPHTEFFFAGAKRGATLEALTYAITHDEGIVKVSGEVGSGKTMLCRMLLEQLPEDVETVYLATPSLSREDIPRAIAGELKIELPDSQTYQTMRFLQERLLEIHASGRRVVVMIDEAHAMPAETLEEIRLLSNLESGRHKLLHIVLFGQPELDERLSERDMRQLKDRITHHFALEPLHRDDIGGYLMFRLQAAGYRGPDLFTPDAIRLIARASQGLSRRINILADKSLLAAFSEGKQVVDSPQIRVAIRDARFSPMSGKHERILVMAGLAILAAASFGWLIGTGRGADPSSQAEVSMVSGNRPAQRAPTLGERIAATDEWLKNTPDTHYFIQFMSTDANNLSDVQLLVEELTARLDPQQIRVYRSRLSGKDRLGVIYGDFASRDAAEARLAQLSHVTPAGAPYVRAVVKLK